MAGSLISMFTAPVLVPLLYFMATIAGLGKPAKSGKPWLLRRLGIGKIVL